MNTLSRLVLFGIVTFCSVILGCSSQNATVTGKVTFRKKAVTSGTVMIVSASSNQPKYGTIKENGTYTVSNVPLGEAKITVNSPTPSANADTKKKMMMGKGKSSPTRKVKSGSSDKNWFPIPREYGDLSKTKLRVTVTSGTTQHDIKLE